MLFSATRYRDFASVVGFSESVNESQFQQALDCLETGALIAQIASRGSSSAGDILSYDKRGGGGGGRGRRGGGGAGGGGKGEQKVRLVVNIDDVEYSLSDNLFQKLT